MYFPKLFVLVLFRRLFILFLFVLLVVYFACSPHELTVLSGLKYHLRS